tara:strand:+ start:3498 stop:4889 length:1392 start_codon:yes stop_codon:yes gene_type:complete
VELPDELREELSREEQVQAAEHQFLPHIDSSLAGKIVITFPNLWAPIELSYDRFREDSRHSCKADLSVYYRAFGRERAIFTGRLDLRGPRNKNDAAKECQGTATSFLQWGDVIQVGCETALEEFRRGEPFVNILNVERRREITYSAWPLVVERNPTIIFGMGGLGKSLIAVYLGVRVSLGPDYNSDLDDGLVVHKRQNVMYLDWEGDEIEVKDRWASICDGIGVAEPSMHYRRMYGSLASQVESVRDMVLKEDIGFICVDSALPAVAGEAESAQATEEFFTILSSLKVSSVIIAHQSKPQIGLSNNMPFGSTFWWNLARSIWQIEAEGEPGQNQLSVGLFHRKVNQGTRQDPLGLWIQFASAIPGINEYGNIKFDKLSLGDSGLREKLGTRQYIEAVLSDLNDAPTGELTVEEILDKMPGKKKTQIEQALSRGKRKNIFLNDAETYKWSITPEHRQELLRRFR